MRLSSSFVAPSAVAILSTALLCGPSGTAMSRTATGPATPLPSITVDAPKQVARLNVVGRPQKPAGWQTQLQLAEHRRSSPDIHSNAIVCARFGDGEACRA